jgi:hypothetical protein
MKYCYTCKRSSPDTFVFCTRCGSSFDVKYCRKLHANSAQAEYCQVCGSSDLSTPHIRPKGSGIVAIVSTAAGLLTALGALVFIITSGTGFDGVSAAEILLGLIGVAGALVLWSHFRTRNQARR